MPFSPTVAVAAGALLLLLLLLLLELWLQLLELLRLLFRRDVWLHRLRESRRSEALKHMPHILRADKRFWFQAVLINGWALKFAAAAIKADKELMMVAVRQDGILIEFAAHHLKRDRELVLAAVQQEAMAMLCCDPVFWTDSEIAVMAIQKNGMLLGLAPRSIKNDREVVLAAVEHNGSALEHADGTLKDDEEIVLAAVQNSGHALQYASESLKSNKTIVLTAVLRAGSSIFFSNDSLKSDKDVVLAAVRQDGLLLKHADNSLRADEDVVLAALENMGVKVPDGSTVKDMILLAVRQSGHVLELAPDELRADRGFVLEAVKAKPGALKYAMGGLHEDAECLTAARRSLERKSSLYGRTEKIILSLRGVSDASEPAGDSAGRRLAIAMKADPILGQFKTHNPSLFIRGSCDPSFTDVSHPCRGTLSTCSFYSFQNLKHGKPYSKSCWRYAYRFHQDECKMSKGFMVQVEEQSKLDDGQIIQMDMANGIGLKTFRLQLRSTETEALNNAVKMLSQEVQSWYETGENDLRLCTVTPPLVFDNVDDDCTMKEASRLTGGRAEFTVDTLGY